MAVVRASNGGGASSGLGYQGAAVFEKLPPISREELS